MKPGSFLHEPQRAFGNALTEYGVIGVLVLLLLIPAVGLAGGSLNSLLKGWRQDMDSHRNQTLQAVSARELEKINTSVRPKIFNSPQQVPEKSSLSQLVATAGANGATRVAADQIALLAQQLKDKQAITDAQYNLLIKLANQGHTLGTLAGLLEDAAKNASSMDFVYKQVTFNGKTMSVIELSNLFGYRADRNGGDMRTSYPVPDDLLNPPYGAYGELQKFLDLYHQTMDSLNTSDPSVKQTVTALSNQIALLNTAIDQSAFKLAIGQISSSQVRDSQVSIVTHKDSGAICTTGKGKDSGVTCTP